MKLVAIGLVEIFLALFLPAILLIGMRYVSVNMQPPLEQTAKIYKDFTLSQSFISQVNKLTGIGMSIKNPNLNNKKDIDLSLYQDNKLIRTSTLNGSHIEDGGFVKFFFDPVSESANKEFLFTLSSPSSEEGESLQPFYTLKKPAESKSFKIQDQEIDGSISFVSFYKPASFLGLTFDVYLKWLNRFFADLIFSLFFLSLILLISIYLITHISTLLLE